MISHPGFFLSIKVLLLYIIIIIINNIYVHAICMRRPVTYVTIVMLYAKYLHNNYSVLRYAIPIVCDVHAEEITTSDKGTCAKRLEREDYWCRELCTFYPYGLNYNVRKVGNISKCKDKIVMNTLFHKQTRKFRKRQPRKHRRKIEVTII